MASNEHIRMKGIGLLGLFHINSQSERRDMQIYGEMTFRAPEKIARLGKFQIYEMRDSSFIIISNN